MTETLVVRVDPSLKRTIERQARDNYRTPSQEVRRALEQAFPQQPARTEASR